jgi:hypothetical protein
MTTFRCPYCLQVLPLSARSVEHLLPAAVGGALTTDACGSCNAQFADEVDKPFLRDLWMREDRHRHQVTERRGRLTPAPRVRCELSDGTPAVAVLDRSGWYAELLPTEEWVDENTFRFSIDANDIAARDKKVARMEKQLGQPVKVASTRSRIIEHPEVKLHYEVEATMWPRFGAKLALGVGALALGSDWLGSAHAQWLHDVLWDNPTTPPEPFGPLAPMPTTFTGDSIGRYLFPPEHVLAVAHTSHGPGLAFYSFSERYYLVPLGVDAHLPEQVAWVLDPVRHKVERMRYEDWMMSLVLRHPSTTVTRTLRPTVTR